MVVAAPMVMPVAIPVVLPAHMPGEQAQQCQAEHAGDGAQCGVTVRDDRHAEAGQPSDHPDQLVQGLGDGEGRRADLLSDLSLDHRVQ
jgi:hypothetical protein